MGYATKEQLKSIMADAATKTKNAVGEKVGEDLLRDTVGWTGKNLLPQNDYKITALTKNGITVSVNDDYSITVNGTATAQTFFDFINNANKFYPGDGDYILSCGTSFTTNNFRVFSNFNDANGTFTGHNVVLQNGIKEKTFSLPYANTTNITFSIVVENGETVNDVTVYPMLRRADITDDTYEPYHESVESEIADKVDWTSHDILGAKNLLKNTATTQTKNGVTFIVNDDKSVTINGTATADTYFNFDYVNNSDTTSKDITNLIGLQLIGSISKTNDEIEFNVGYFKSNGYVDIISGLGSIYTYKEFVYPAEALRTKNFIRIRNGIALNNVTIYPMIRLASDPDDTYVPYAMTNKELTDKVRELEEDGGGSSDPGASGHTIIDADGNEMAARSKLQIIGAEISDDETNDVTIVTITGGGSSGKTYNYGFKINPDDSNPESSVTYLEDAVDMTPAHMDYSAGAFDYGSWEDAFFMPKPCMVKSNGTVDYYLDPNDYTKKEDGSASDVANTSYDGNAMMEWGQNGDKIYYKVDSANNSVYISNKQIDENYHAYSFINSKGAEVDHFYTPIYNGSLISSKLRSLSGQQVSNKTTAEQEVNYAKANNPGSDEMWNIDLMSDRTLINFLLILMGKSLQTQTVYGEGLHTSGSETVNNSFRTGVHNTKGLFYGTNSGEAATYTNAVKVFGMENWWGFQWRRILGWINDSGTQKVKFTYGKEDGTTVDGYNLTGEGYKTISDATPAGTSGGYINKVKFTDDGVMVPYQASGSATTYFCDGLYFNNSGVKVARVGGGSGDGARVGAFCSDLSRAASTSGWNVGAALSLKPLA